MSTYCMYKGCTALGLINVRLSIFGPVPETRKLCFKHAKEARLNGQVAGEPAVGIVLVDLKKKEAPVATKKQRKPLSIANVPDLRAYWDQRAEAYNIRRKTGSSWREYKHVGAAKTDREALARMVRLHKAQGEDIAIPAPPAEPTVTTPAGRVGAISGTPLTPPPEQGVVSVIYDVDPRTGEPWTKETAVAWGAVYPDRPVVFTPDRAAPPEHHRGYYVDFDVPLLGNCTNDELLAELFKRMGDPKKPGSIDVLFCRRRIRIDAVPIHLADRNDAASCDLIPEDWTLRPPSRVKEVTCPGCQSTDLYATVCWALGVEPTEPTEPTEPPTQQWPERCNEHKWMGVEHGNGLYCTIAGRQVFMPTGSGPWRFCKTCGEGVRCD